MVLSTLNIRKGRTVISERWEADEMSLKNAPGSCLEKVSRLIQEGEIWVKTRDLYELRTLSCESGKAKVTRVFQVKHQK